ncbi:MAG: hypothetical protein WBB28_03780 [Crinalium sp.]|uniref:Uncharacterized protein n=1 Tax=Crinalium epipsammum PCC 9333 TaxID=1173022 RepID=K9VVT1_9CYAN|nr:hypothetical protein [Crinalium epipsammum]AFZ11587.1 hypothetical protein Cri9333_0645 [Crinalium epipsammum PCC 9333]
MDLSFKNFEPSALALLKPIAIEAIKKGSVRIIGCPETDAECKIYLLNNSDAEGYVNLPEGGRQWGYLKHFLSRQSGISQNTNRTRYNVKHQLAHWV